MSRWAIAPVIDGLIALETGANALRLKGFQLGADSANEPMGDSRLAPAAQKNMSRK